MTGETAAAAVVDDGPVDVNAAVNNAANDANDHTPDPAPVPVVEQLPAPPADPVDAAPGLNELAESFATLAGTVATLQELVLGKVVENDEAPKAQPWTHRFGGRRS